MSDHFIEEQDTESILKSQRQGGEAADIITEMDKVKSTPPEKLGRWIWELLQNARDCARTDLDGKKFVNVRIELSENGFSFQHDGKCFTPSDLISLFRKASNKNYQNEEGNSGKYGTGFVTTHLLSRRIFVDGYMQRVAGKKHFRLEMDRTSNDPRLIHDSLSKTFAAIEQIRTADGYDEILDFYTRFEYPLTETKYQLARETIQELKSNIYFTLRCNSWIQSVTVVEHAGGVTTETVLKEHTPLQVSQNLAFYPFTDGVNGKAEKGLLFFAGPQLKIGVLASKDGDSYNLIPLGRVARLYKDFPLIGTEDWNLPYLIQSEQFRPPEQRDGVRLKKSSDEDDPVADVNRAVFSDLSAAVEAIFQDIKSAKVSNVHFLVETGLPADPFHHVDISWYVTNVQTPLRAYFRDQPVVRTADQALELKTVNECLFIDYPNEQAKSTFYELVSELKPGRFPNKDSYLSWDLILHQEKDKWPTEIFYSPETLIDEVVSYKTISAFPFGNEKDSYNWLNRLFTLIKEYNIVQLDTKAIFPCQANTLRPKSGLKIDTLENDDFKAIVGILDSPILPNLVSNQLDIKDGFEPLDTKDFIKVFHDNISKIDVRTISNEQKNSLLDLVCLFRGAPSPARQEMYSLVRDLLPETPEQRIVEDMAYYDWVTPDLLVVKLCCSLVEKQATLIALAKTYFKDDSGEAMKWLKRLRSYLFKEEERRAPLLLKFKVVPMQSGNLDCVTNDTRAEDAFEPFPKKVKDIYRDHLKGKNPYTWLVDREMGKESFLLISLEDFCKPIDNVFFPDGVDSKVKPNGPYNKFFSRTA